MAGQVSVRGGGRAEEFLLRMARRLGTGAVVRVGFFATATYPARRDRRRKNARGRAKYRRTLYVAQVAFWNNFGTVRSPPRPFFSNMIRQQSPTWPRKLALAARKTKYDAHATLALLGTDIAQKLRTAIVQWPKDNAPSTVERKGFNKGLIDSAVMMRSIGFEVSRS